MTITIDIFKLTVTLISVLSFICILYVCYKVNKAYKLLKQDRIVNVTILPGMDGEVDVFDR